MMFLEFYPIEAAPGSKQDCLDKFVHLYLHFDASYIVSENSTLTIISMHYQEYCVITYSIGFVFESSYTAFYFVESLFSSVLVIPCFV